MQYLIDLADQGITHNIPDLRERVQQLLNLIPSGKNPAVLWLFMYSVFFCQKLCLATKYIRVHTVQYCAKVTQTIIDEYRKYRDISAIFNKNLP